MDSTTADPEIVYQSFVDTMPEGALVIHPETTRIVYCNSSFSGLFLTAPDNLVGVCLADLVGPEDRKQFYGLLETAERHPAKGHVTLMCPAAPVLTCMSCAILPGVKPRVLAVVLSPAAALFESQTLAAAILDQATEAIVLCDRSGRVTHANLAAHRLAGRDPCSMPFNEAFPLKRRVIGFRAPADCSEIEERLVFSQLSAGRIVRGIHACLAVPHRHVILLLSGGPIGSGTEQNNGTVITLTDITRQTEAESALRASENRYSQVVQQAEEGICLLDSTGEILDANQSLGRILGRPPEELIGRRIRDVDFLSQLEPDRARLQEEAGRQTVIGERCVNWEDGTPRFIEGSAKVMPNGTLLLIIRDITERRLLEKEIAEITRREERRIGRDLYDLLAQQLAGVGFLNKVLEQKLQARGLKESHDAHRIGDLVRDAIRQTRHLAEGLCPIEFNADGLISALKELCRSSEEHSGIPCRFAFSGTPALPDKASETQLYLIARELVRASVSLANASHVTVRLEDGDKATQLVIEHDGRLRGIEKPLKIVRYRASLIAADLNVRRESKLVQVRCTLKHEKSKANAVSS